MGWLKATRTPVSGSTKMAPWCGSMFVTAGQTVVKLHV